MTEDTDMKLIKEALAVLLENFEPILIKVWPYSNVAEYSDARAKREKLVAKLRKAPEEKR